MNFGKPKIEYGRRPTQQYIPTKEEIELEKQLNNCGFDFDEAYAERMSANTGSLPLGSTPNHSLEKLPD